MATTRYYDPPSGTWKTDQSTVPSIPGGTTLTINMIYGLTAALSDLSTRLSALTADQQASATAVNTRLTAVEQANSQVGSVISDALSGYVTTGALAAALAQVFWVVPYGTGWAASRPSTTRPTLAYGGPAAPTWQKSSLGDVWLGTL